MTEPDLVVSPLRLCGYCRSWNSRPCGEQCCLSTNDPTWEQVNAQAGDPPKALLHAFKPHRKYPWFCADCGYPPHETLKHSPEPTLDHPTPTG